MTDPAHRPNRSAWALVLGLLAAACVSPAGDPDYRDTYPLKAELATTSLSVKLAPTGSLSDGADDLRFRLFVREFKRRARSPMLVATQTQGDGAAAQGRVEKLRLLLVRQGVSPRDIVFNLGREGGGEAVILSFRGYRVQALKCGDWSGQAGFDMTNRPHTNYACAFQRNIGLMLVDPGDLAVARSGGTFDGQRAVGAIKKYREGKAAGSALPTSEQGTISDVE